MSERVDFGLLAPSVGMLRSLVLTDRKRKLALQGGSKRHHNATTHVLRFVWMFHRFQSCFDDFSVGFFKTHVLIFSVVFHAAV